MKRFWYMAEGGRLNYLDAHSSGISSEMVYRTVSCFYMPSTRIIIIDTETHEASIFTRKLDHNGNLVCIIDEMNGKEIY